MLRENDRAAFLPTEDDLDCLRRMGDINLNDTFFRVEHHPDPARVAKAEAEQGFQVTQTTIQSNNLSSNLDPQKANQFMASNISFGPLAYGVDLKAMRATIQSVASQDSKEVGLEPDTGSYVKVKQAVLKTKTQLGKTSANETPKTMYGPKSFKVSHDQETINSNKRMVFSKLVKHGEEVDSSENNDTPVGEDEKAALS